LQKLKLRLEDMVREEGMEIEVGKSKGWIWGFVNFWLGNWELLSTIWPESGSQGTESFHDVPILLQSPFS
jgi:hypothetical protein